MDSGQIGNAGSNFPVQEEVRMRELEDQMNCNDKKSIVSVTSVVN